MRGGYGMKTAMAKSLLLVVLSIAGVGLGWGQSRPDHGAFRQVRLSEPTATHLVPPEAGEVVREIDDPQTGDRWLLTRDPSCPSGPGRLVLAAVGLDTAHAQGPEGSNVLPKTAKLIPVIHTGDHLVVEENTRVAEVILEATALGPALLESPLQVRLSIGGNVVRAIALGPGRAVFVRKTGARP